MENIINLLNHTSPARVVFYSVVFLVALCLLLLGIADILKVIFRQK